MTEPNDFRMQRPLGSKQIAESEQEIGDQNQHGCDGGAAKNEISDGQTFASLMSKLDGVRNVATSIEFLNSAGLTITRKNLIFGRHNPSSLSPDMLYPIIDATTVKRTRQFVKKHYGGDTIRLPDGTETTIVFPKPQAMTVRYGLEAPLPELFDLIEVALDPDGSSGALKFARYMPEHYRRGEHDAEEDARSAAMVGLLRSGLLKRFESSAHAFRETVKKLVVEHNVFLEALGKGHVVTTRFLRELAVSDESTLDDLLSGHGEAMPSGEFQAAQLRRAVEDDLALLRKLLDAAAKITPERDTKLKAIVSALEEIAAQAAEESLSAEDEAQKRKVIVFSFFADTVRYLRETLGREIERNPKLAPFRGRIVAVSGGDDIESDVSRQKAVNGFAPVSSEAPPGSDADLFDLMIATDVLAEGVNLQQCRNIINADLPWNPMRLVQRHGRVDRIGSPHAKVFLRTVFPAERLDALLNLEARIMRKIAMAASSIGVEAPVAGAAAGDQVFSETREEIERLLRDDASLFERGGTAGAAQTGEEYRQTLRKVLADGRERIVTMPWGAGSAMTKGRTQGVFFCAAVGDRTYLRFLKTGADWMPVEANGGFVREIGTCLRLIECEEATARDMPSALEQNVFDLWAMTKNDIWQSWMVETDPANLQPKVRPLNQRVAEFIRANRPPDDDGPSVNRSLDILETPWPRREEELLRGWFNDDVKIGAEKARYLVERVLETGLEPFNQPAVLPPIDLEDINLICWMGVKAGPTETLARQ